MSAAGVLLGTAVGDALGLPWEGMGAGPLALRLGDGPLEHAFWRGWGVVSDDTDHAALVAQALVASRGEPEAFSRALASGLRRWMLTLPPGIGFGTVRACLKLLVGVPRTWSGVNSAGNGPAMRSALLGVFARDEAHLYALVRASTRLTHTDRRAEEGARVVALAARAAGQVVRGDLAPDDLLDSLEARISDSELRDGLRTVGRHLGEPVVATLRALGLDQGVGGYVNDTVPAALACWLAHPRSYGAAVETAVRAGGDTDTVAAIVGAISGAGLGARGIPVDWIAGIAGPRGPMWLEELGRRVAAVQVGLPESPMAQWAWFDPLRNLAILGISIGHLCRRVDPFRGVRSGRAATREQ